MADARSDATTVNIDAACKPKADGEAGQVFNFRASGSGAEVPRLPYALPGGPGRGGTRRENSNSLPELTPGDSLNCQQLEANQHFTQPPPRFTEATLVKAMEERGIGRPSTYAPTIGVLLKPQVRGTRRATACTRPSWAPPCLTCWPSFFTEIMNPDFTAQMEEKLDEVSQGERDWVPMLEEFYGPFAQELLNANENMPRVKPDDEATDEVCENCGMAMVIKTGRFGRFMACTGYPQCRTTKQIKEGEDEAGAADMETDEICEQCGKPMVLKTGRYGKFIACSNYPTCKNTHPMKTGASCPRCGGDLVERGSRRGVFFGCANYPECKYTNNRRPLPEPCPECQGLMVVNRDGSQACTVCAWKVEAPQNAPDGEGSSGREQELATVGN